VFFTHPGDGITPVRAFFNEIVLTGILVLGIFAVTDEYNTQAPRADSSALIIGLLVAMIGGAGGYLEAWPINPARDFGPRLFCYFAGWGSAAFPAPLDYWWVPIAGPFCGGVAGATVYQALIRPFLPSRQIAATPLPDPGWDTADRSR
jgi:glycerol uptake facilitator protein